MKTRTAGIAIAVVLVGVGIWAYYLSGPEEQPGQIQASEIKWYGFEDGTALARKENKKILVDVYTDWCVWCKKLDKEVYTNAAVGQHMSAHFIAVKLNAESQKSITFEGTSMSEASLASSMGVTGYPTIIFLDPESKPITRISGYMEPKEFTSVLRYVGEDQYKSTSFDEFRKAAAE
ncbi:MAG TPA: thioredoxin fold domain-containing protein [Bacteroidota bacterium]|nr:thioredoxin fold domain-containing protein [Bacteroidota bacterium]